MSSQKSNNGVNKRVRTRNFATLVYPESAPANWQDILRDEHIPAFISPLHDKDLTDSGDMKKAHYHVMVMFDNVKTQEQAKEIFNEIGGVGCEIVKSPRAMARYLKHLDDPDKAQYSDDVIALGGADYYAVIGDEIDRFEAITEMEDFCDKYNVNSYYLLSKYARNHRPDWAKVLLMCGSIHMDKYLKSRKWSVDNNELNIVDPETGEKIL